MLCKPKYLLHKFLTIGKINLSEAAQLENKLIVTGSKSKG
jgi:hypothetical protein